MSFPINDSYQKLQYLELTEYEIRLKHSNILAKEEINVVFYVYNKT